MSVVSNGDYLKDKMNGLISEANSVLGSLNIANSSYSSTTKVPKREPDIIKCFLNASSTFFEKIVKEADSINSVGVSIEQWDNFLANKSVDLNMEIKSSNVNVVDVTAIDRGNFGNILSTDVPDYDGKKEDLGGSTGGGGGGDNGYYYNDYTNNNIDDNGNSIVEAKMISNEKTVIDSDSPVQVINSNENLSDNNENLYYDTLENNDYDENQIMDINNDDSIVNDDDMYDDLIFDDSLELNDSSVDSPSEVINDVPPEVSNAPIKQKKSNIGKVIAGLSVAGVGAGAYSFYKKKKENDDI